MPQDVESIYDEYISKLKQAMPNVDPGLSHRVMYLERKLSGEDMVDPDVSAIIEYTQGSDVDKKVDGLRSKYSVEVEHKNGKAVHIVGRMKIDKLRQISADKDIVRISGKVDSGYGE